MSNGAHPPGTGRGGVDLGVDLMEVGQLSILGPRNSDLVGAELTLNSGCGFSLAPSEVEVNIEHRSEKLRPEVGIFQPR